MDWQKSMNRAMEYIENNLSGDIDYSVAAQCMNCSEWEFRRIFSFMAQIPMSEYIRRRRLTVAAADVQGGEKIIDIALRYGYKSQAAFSRAFRQMHGIAPSEARDKAVKLSAFPRLAFKLVLMEGMGKNSANRSSIIGAGEVGSAVTIDVDRDTIHKINELFWSGRGSDILGTTALPSYGAFVTEEKCQILGDVAGKKILEIGCGSGQSLSYLGARKTAELWGMDISGEQLAKTRRYLAAHGFSAKLICSPMEVDAGIPTDYFDAVLAIYAIGWTTDIDGTLSRIASYLKKGGVFIFSWSHPIHKCVASEDGMLIFKKCYFDESQYSVSLGGGTLSLSDRKLSTYINALSKAGFIIDRMVEDSEEERLKANGGDFAEKAKMLPVTFVIKARKQ